MFLESTSRIIYFRENTTCPCEGHSEVIQPLVQHGADVDQFIAPSGFPLHVACSHQHLSSVRKLLQLGENAWGLHHVARLR
ncbi:Ankyrin repeat and SOCS box protein 5 [Liparis tanakae]|uniref:Ankyrin repeat and SOCS box protein 5 n=1 Tax=Liparis tanakae TaxID=230148 RepID=A0A4Z2E8G4_9TELE|nr:Ankyrin repeat and SOCS box protein 5 [Liparis tanakae]